MITHAHIQNFRCLKEVQFDLGPLTAFVGPNASGKSSILAALNPGRTMSERDRWRRHGDTAVSIRLQGEDDYSLTRSLGRGGETLRTPNHGLTPPHVAQVLHLDPGQLRNQNQVQRSMPLHPEGDNLANVFATLSRQQQTAVAESLRTLVPAYGDVDLEPVQNGFHQLRFYDRWEPTITYEPAEVSEGTMLLLAFLVVQHQSPPVDLLAIEEPEHGLHPYLIGEVVAMLRKLSRGEIGPRAVQVVLATHSAELLNYLEPQEVRFLTRTDVDGSVSVSAPPIDTEQWAQAYREYRESLGGMWLAGGLGGVPGREG